MSEQSFGSHTPDLVTNQRWYKQKQKHTDGRERERERWGKERVSERMIESDKRRWIEGYLI